MGGIRLFVEEGYNRGALYEVAGERGVLGRSEECEVLLSDDDVSRRHAEIVRGGDGLVVHDLGSRNGTRVNGVRIERAAVEPGDRVAVGGVRLLVLSPGGPVAPARVAGGLDRPTVELDLGDPAARPRPGLDEDEVLGESPAIAALLDRVARAAAAPTTVLLSGESGTGKELVARAIHRLSPRRRRPFVPVNCAALPVDLFESELFGHEKGAFTGALARKAGLVEAAAGGTLFLDEVGEMPLASQAKVLRFLESGEYRRVGSTAPLEVDVRIVAATNRRLDASVADGTFREDLLYRLRVVELAIPPLRERAGDARLLADRFRRRLGGERRPFSEAALEAIARHLWPGNVRELRNAIESALILTSGARIEVWDLPERVRGTPAAGAAGPEGGTLAELERRAIASALARHEGHRTRTAEALGIDRKTLYKKLRELGLG